MEKKCGKVEEGQRVKILFAAAEATPFIKTGGLADVIGALPKVLSEKGHNVKVIMPKYAKIPAHYKAQMRHIGHTEVSLGWRKQYAGVEALELEGVSFYFIDNEYYFGRDEVYGYHDDGERFSFLNKAILELLPLIEFYPDVLHCHDWHTAMVPLLLQEQYQGRESYEGIATVFTIHNLLYQGIYPSEMLGDVLGLPAHYVHPERIEFQGNISFMKEGLKYSDHVTTVSPTYANEIKTAFYGYGLEGVLQSIDSRLTGIVNGIDTAVYDPNHDELIAVKYQRSLQKRSQNKTKFQQEVGLHVEGDVPLIGMVTRLVEPKGLDLVTRVLDEWLIQDGVQFVILGTGDHHYERWFSEAAHRFPGQMAAIMRFDEGLSHRVYASSDLFLMPSRFEPCGISQLLALRYGSIPVVRETGGLNDTVHSYQEYEERGNGFTFKNYNAHDMLYTLRRGVSMYRHNKEKWNHLVQRALSEDHSWSKSAQAYVDVYNAAIQHHQVQNK